MSKNEKENETVVTPEEGVSESERPQEIRQNHPFVSVDNEVKRVYIFPNNERIEVEGVVAMSVAPDGGHRLFTRMGQNIAFKVAPNWLVIQYMSAEDEKQPYVFSKLD